MAGRNISVDRWALGSTRVMRTCGMMGEVVGKAAWISVRHHTTPRGVYEQYLDILKDLMSKPGAMRRDSLEGDLYLPANAKAARGGLSDSIDPKKLEGIVIDDEDAELTGTWSTGEGLKPFVGNHYSYSQAKDASARFSFAVKETGKYEVVIYWQPHENRAKAAPVSVLSAEGEKTFRVKSKPARRRQAGRAQPGHLHLQRRRGGGSSSSAPKAARATSTSTPCRSCACPDVDDGSRRAANRIRPRGFSRGRFFFLSPARLPDKTATRPCFEESPSSV
jgi:hypothetical protein